MSICLLAAGKTIALSTTVFTLSWIHSVQKTEWQEDWRLGGQNRLEIVEARIKGSGAGMEPPDGAVLEDGYWTYRPNLPPRNELVLASSGATPSAWTVCANDSCIDLFSPDNTPVKISYCSDEPSEDGLSQPR